MNIKTLNVQMVDEYREMSMYILCLFRPLHAKLFRVITLPYCDDMVSLENVLDMLCVRKKDGIWYFKATDADWLEDFLRIVDLMGVVGTSVETDEVHWN